MKVSTGRTLAAAALGLLVGACALAPAPPPMIDGTPIEIVPPARPLAVPAFVRAGSFGASRTNPQGIVTEFADVLRAARVFASVADTPPPEGASGRALELRLAASDYGEPDAYSMQLQVALVRGRELLTQFQTKQSIRQPPGTRRELTIGPVELGQLAERAIRDLVRQIAADAERIGKL